MRTRVMDGRIGTGRLRNVVGALLLGAGLLAPATAGAATGTFVDVPGIPGDSTFPPATGQIQALSFTWGITPARASRYGATGVCSAGHPKPVFQSLCVLKHVDKSSPKLMLATAQGTNFTKVTISVFDLGQPSNPALDVYELSNAIVSSVETGSLQGDEIPTEKVCFNFNQVKFTVNKQDAAGGPVDTVTTSFNTCLRNVP